MAFHSIKVHLLDLAFLETHVFLPAYAPLSAEPENSDVFHGEKQFDCTHDFC